MTRYCTFSGKDKEDKKKQKVDLRSPWAGQHTPILSTINRSRYLKNCMWTFILYQSKNCFKVASNYLNISPSMGFGLIRLYFTSSLIYTITFQVQKKN